MDSEEKTPGGDPLAPAVGQGNESLRDIIDRLYARVRSEVIEGDFDLGDAMVLGNIVMEALNAYPGVSNENKHKIVLHIVDRVIDDVPMDEGLRAGLKLAANTALDKVIKFVVQAWYKHFDRNKDGHISAEEYRKKFCGCVPKAD